MIEFRHIRFSNAKLHIVENEDQGHREGDAENEVEWKKIPGTKTVPAAMIIFTLLPMLLL